jgi:hypothetical protein
MIFWREGKAAFVGASKYLIKGVFQLQYSVTSAFMGAPTVSFGVLGQIDESGGVYGKVSTPELGLTGAISATGTGLLGQADDSGGVYGSITTPGKGIFGDIS